MWSHPLFSPPRRVRNGAFHLTHNTCRASRRRSGPFTSRRRSVTTPETTSRAFDGDHAGTAGRTPDAGAGAAVHASPIDRLRSATWRSTTSSSRPATSQRPPASSRPGTGCDPSQAGAIRGGDREPDRPARRRLPRAGGGREPRGGPGQRLRAVGGASRLPSPPSSRLGSAAGRPRRRSPAAGARRDVRRARHSHGRAPGVADGRRRPGSGRAVAPLLHRMGPGVAIPRLGRLRHAGPARPARSRRRSLAPRLLARRPRASTGGGARCAGRGRRHRAYAGGETVVEAVG